MTKPVISKTPVGDWQIDWPDGNARTVFTWEIAMFYVAAYYRNGALPWPQKNSPQP